MTGQTAAGQLSPLGEFVVHCHTDARGAEIESARATRHPRDISQGPQTMEPIRGVKGMHDVLPDEV